MKLVPNDEFEDWLAKNSIGRDPQYPQASHLHFWPVGKESRFWNYPSDADDYDRFFLSIIAQTPLASGGWLYPPAGVWTDGVDSSVRSDKEMAGLLSPLGWTDEFRGALYFKSTEKDQTIKVLSRLITHSRLPDPFIIPVEKKYILFFDHHLVVHVEFEQDTSITPFVKALEENGIFLPTEFPDWTFKPVSWMNNSKRRS